MPPFPVHAPDVFERRLPTQIDVHRVAIDAQFVARLPVVLAVDDLTVEKFDGTQQPVLLDVQFERSEFVGDHLWQRRSRQVNLQHR